MVSYLPRKNRPGVPPAVEPARPAPPPARPPGTGSSVSLGTASLILGLLGLGPVALALGVVALRRRQPGRGRALAGVVLGAAGTLGLLLLLFLPRSAPVLDDELIPGHTLSWVRLVAESCDQYETRADRLNEALGSLIEQEITPIYGIIAGIRLDLELVEHITDEEELAELQDDILDRLRQCREFLARQ